LGYFRHAKAQVSVKANNRDNSRSRQRFDALDIRRHLEFT